MADRHDARRAGSAVVNLHGEGPKSPLEDDPASGLRVALGLGTGVRLRRRQERDQPLDESQSTGFLNGNFTVSLSLRYSSRSCSSFDGALCTGYTPTCFFQAAK